MLLDKRINYESVDALKTILIKSINSGEEVRVLNNLKIFDESIQKLFTLSNDRFEEILLKEESKESKNPYWTEEENYSSSFNSILVFYSECIKVAIESNKINIAIEFKSSFNKILRKYLLKKKNIVLLKMFFKKQEELFKYCIDADNGLSHSFGYHWYYDLTFDWSNTYGLFDLNYLELFDKQLFKYIQYSIQRRNKKWLNGWINWLHDGIGFMDLNRFSPYSYFKGIDLSKDMQDLDEIDNKFKNINSLEKYNDFVEKFTLLNEKFKNNDSINIQEKNKKQNDVIKKALTNYLFHNTKHLLFSSFAYALYKNFYDLLYEMLNINNSSKSDVIMIGHKVLPQNIIDIIDLLMIRKDEEYYDVNSKFVFGEPFSENKYYEAMLTFILIIHLKIDKDNISFNNEKYSISELMFLKEKVNYLKEKVNDIKIYKDELKKQNEEFDLEISKQELMDVFNKLFSDIESKINKKIDDSKISENRVNELKDGFYNEYEKSSDNVRNTLFTTDVNIFKQEDYNENNKKFGLKNKLPRRFFVEETNTCVEYLGKQYAENFIRAINTEILKEILNKSEQIFINQLDEIIKKIGQDNIIIFSTGYLEILNNNKNFKHSWEIPNNEHTLNADAYYKYEKNNIPIFSCSTNFDDSKTFIINKKKFLTLIEYEPSLENENIKDNIYFSIDEINDDKENVILNLYTTFEIEFEKDFECFYIEG
jgi:hypothetical protein